MLVKNKKGEIEGMSYDEATAAVTAKTHSFVNVEEKDGEFVPKADTAKEPHPPQPDPLVAGELSAGAPVREVSDVSARKSR